MDTVSRDDLLNLPEELKAKIRSIWQPHRGQKIFNLLDFPQNPEMWEGYIITDMFDNGNDPYFFVEYTHGQTGGVWKNSSLPELTKSDLASVVRTIPIP